MINKIKTIIIIPSFNEGNNIKNVIEEIKSILPSIEIVVIDDGSSDNTSQVALDSGAMVLTHPFNMGYGTALQTGYKYANLHKYDYIIQMDADGQHLPETALKILNTLKENNADVVIGSRFLSDASYTPPFVRRVAMCIFAKLVSLLTGLKISDSTSGLQGFKKKVLAFLISDYFPADYPDADLILMLHRSGFSIIEIPALMKANDGKSMHSGVIRPIYYVFRMFLSILVTLLRKLKKDI